MKNSKLYPLLFIVIFLIACTKEYKSTEVGIEYELHDDVSPVMATLKINKNLHYAEWVIDDTIFYNVGGENTIEHIFKKEGISNVEINASGLNNEKYFGNIQISVPPIASKLKIKGFYIAKSVNLNLTNDLLKITFSYYNSNNYEYFSREVTKSEIENQDSIIFEEPIVIDITGFKNTYNYWFYFYIQGANEQDIYYKTNFTLKEIYYNDRITTKSLDRIVTWNILEKNNNKVTIYTNWIK
ncbi:MAG: hypothetical protein B6I20_07450 [Bacteroidetes bacterium 4572_117]|nr:MAG: hypothetical protein B6I20_07450 [Bacteroidetes bacterium 4572_117]